MPVPLFANRPQRCPYGHSLTPGMPQKISWLPCICTPASEAAQHGRGMGHMTAWCGTCSAEDHREHQVLRAAARGGPQLSAHRLGSATGRLSASETQGQGDGHGCGPV